MPFFVFDVYSMVASQADEWYGVGVLSNFVLFTGCGMFCCVRKALLLNSLRFATRMWRDVKEEEEYLLRGQSWSHIRIRNFFFFFFWKECFFLFSRELPCVSAPIGCFKSIAPEEKKNKLEYGREIVLFSQGVCISNKLQSIGRVTNETGKSVGWLVQIRKEYIHSADTGQNISTWRTLSNIRRNTT